jgi:hypothetical protein
MDLIQPTNGMPRQRLSQPAAIFVNALSRVANVVSQIQAVVGG